jgi:uncharacterized membrane protein
MAEKQDGPILPGQPTYAFHGNERLAALSDGIFAITITLLVLEIKVPELSDHGLVGDLSTALFHLVPKILSHLISFVVLGLYWVAHHNMFAHIKRHDHVLLWLNILLMMCVASIPFPTGLISEYPDHQISVIIYASVLAFTGIVMDTIWWYANYRGLVDETVEPAFIAFVHRYVRIAPITYLIAILASFVSLAIAKLLFVGIVVFYILPKSYHRTHYRQLARRFNQ